ncbi:DUF92 domain-containing protein [Pyrobaculum neutrophilum]|uniref:DUF92 domain-containing protein n=1 Tax=Pyrobaculum neutrophilum (strain DSM 2338 / JCM 9278 / NBRC 100436 / V24Sta) TaxID=444157 RepID=B1YAP4_PYRNV|nr:DUF92 domain-containing protein [Pyrobaculum neutrophilum]ACB39123.1 protein of unknown function DUF92 transmembrane [Pyrobaculum neutrophilum V24Sta]
MEPQIVAVPSIVVLALLALRKGFLTVRGTVSAIAVGTAVAVAHLGLFGLTAAFFLTSSLLTKLRAEWKLERGLKDVSGRSLRQVFGVGAPIAAFALAYLASGDVRLLGAAAVAVAAATADTWASEVGVAYGGTPRYILAPWRRVEPGTSGGVTPVGVAASAAGALAMGALAPLLGIQQPFWKIALFGYLGELLDSVLGASLQVKYICGGRISEQPAAGCRRRGFLTNEAVNLVSGFAVGLLYLIT